MRPLVNGECGAIRVSVRVPAVAPGGYLGWVARALPLTLANRARIASRMGRQDMSREVALKVNGEVVRVNAFCRRRLLACSPFLSALDEAGAGA